MTAAPAAVPERRETLPVPAAALAGLAAGAAGLGAAELAAGILPGTASPIVAVGDLIIALQPPGAKQFVVDLFGEADKLVLNLVIAAGAVALTAGLGILWRSRPGLARLGFVGIGIFVLAAALADELSDPVPTLLVAAISVAIAIGVCTALFRLAGRPPPTAEMPAWGRRRFIGTSLGVIGLAVAGGALGRVLLDRGRLVAGGEAAPPIPAASGDTPQLPSGADLDVEGLAPIVTPNDEFYRIDTALIVPRPNVSSWQLRVFGRVSSPFELTYEELLAMPLVEQYVTIACVSNEVGGGLVGNALWRGVRLKELLDRAGLQAGASQVVGRSVDGFTVGFPTEWVLADERESLVAVAMNGEPLPPEHGYPARLIVPGLYGYVSATKWLSEIELTGWNDFDAYWVPLGWAKEAPILTQSRIDVPRNGAQLPAGTVAVAGVAWAPDRGVDRVEVQVDDGEWAEAELSTPISDATWVQFVRRWQATPGRHTLRVRATDGTGEVQTADVTRPAPDGARGRHAITVEVA